MFDFLFVLVLLPFMDEGGDMNGSFLEFAKDRHVQFMEDYSEGEFEMISNTSQSRSSVLSRVKVLGNLYVDRDFMLVQQGERINSKLSEDQILRWQDSGKNEWNGEWEAVGIRCTSSKYDFAIRLPAPGSTPGTDGPTFELEKLEMLDEKNSFSNSQRRGGYHLDCVGAILGVPLIEAVEKNLVKILEWEENGSDGPRLLVAYNINGFRGTMQVTIEYYFDMATRLVREEIEKIGGSEYKRKIEYTTGKKPWISRLRFQVFEGGKEFASSLTYCGPFASVQVDKEDFMVSSYGFPEPAVRLKPGYPWGNILLFIFGALLISVPLVFAFFKRKMS